MGPDGCLDHEREVSRFPRVVRGDDVDAKVSPHPGGVVERCEHAAGVAGTAIVLKPQGHQRYPRGNADNPKAVVGHRTDRAGDVGAVAITVERQVVVVDEVPAVDVVDESIAVIVDAVAGDLTGVGPDVPGQVGMVDVDA